MPRVTYRYRPSWYNNSVSQEVGRRANVTVDPERFSKVWKWEGRDFGPVRHPRVQKELISRKSLTPRSVMSEIELKARNPRLAKIMDANKGIGQATAYARATSPKVRRRETFNDAANIVNERFVDRLNDEPKISRRHPDIRRMNDSIRRYEVAAESQYPRSPEAIWRRQYHNVKPAQTLPYRPATARSGRVPVPPRPTSGVAPRIAGTAASAILRGTGALGLLPGIVHLARGGTFGQMSGPIPTKVLPKKVQRRIARNNALRGEW